MRFTHAHILFWLWALVPVAGIMVYGIRSQKRILDRFVRPEHHQRMVPGLANGPAWIRLVLVILGLGLCLFSLAGPQAGFKWEKTRQRGVDIMIALDCSQSMLASDVSPNRLERAKREIIDLTRRLRSDRAGLVAFSGQAVLQCPLTMDYQAFQIFLDVLGPDYLPVGGTDLAAALETCYRGFDAAADTEKAIIVITDGEDTTQRGQKDLDTIVQTLSREKIKVFTIGVGDPAGAPVPDKGGGFKRDDSGAIVMSRVNETGLDRMSLATGGRYVRSVAGDMDLEQIYGQDILGTMARSRVVQGQKKVWENRFQWALLPGILLLLAELFVKSRTGKSKSPWKTAGCVVLGLCLLGISDPARADLFKNPVRQGMDAYDKKEFQRAKNVFINAQLDNPDDPRLYYNIGAAAYAAGEYALARDNFSQALASADKTLRQDALYNLANTRYKMGDLKGAVEDYERLLKRFPKDTQAKENLDFVKKKLAQQNQKKKEQSSDDPEQTSGQDSDEDEQGQDNQGQNNQDEQNQDRQNSQKPGNPGQDQKKSSGQQRQGQKDSGAQAQKHKADAGGQQADAGSQQADDQDAESGQTRAATGSDLSPEAAQMLESKLNRLKDTPGKALIPAGQAQAIEQDW